jgi:hypothetical protein
VLLHEEVAFGGLDGVEVHDAHVVGGGVDLHGVRLRVCFSILWRRLYCKGVGSFNFFQGGGRIGP